MFILPCLLYKDKEKTSCNNRNKNFYMQPRAPREMYVSVPEQIIVNSVISRLRILLLRETVTNIERILNALHINPVALQFLFHGFSDLNFFCSSLFPEKEKIYLSIYKVVFYYDLTPSVPRPVE